VLKRLLMLRKMDGFVKKKVIEQSAGRILRKIDLEERAKSMQVEGQLKRESMVWDEQTRQFVSRSKAEMEVYKD